MGLEQHEIDYLRIQHYSHKSHGKYKRDNDAKHREHHRYRKEVKNKYYSSLRCYKTKQGMSEPLIPR